MRELRLSDDTEIGIDDPLLTGCCEFSGMFGYSTIGPLPTHNVLLPPGLQVGDYWVTAVVDPEGLINEGIGGDDDNDAVSVRQVRVIDDAILLENFDDGVNVTELLMTAYMSVEQERAIPFPPPDLASYVPAVARGEWNPRTS